METNILTKLSRDLQITPEFIIREYWEMTLLNELVKSCIGSNLIFKGGTALRLGYGSPRFSEDLDFDLNKSISLSDFTQTVEKIINKFSEISLKDLAEKYNTFIAQIRVKEENLPKSFSIKIEISKRYIREKKYYEPKLLISPINSAQILINAARIEEIKKEKLQAVKTRKQTRDLFDLWYISQLEKTIWQCPKHSFNLIELKKELNKFLP